MFNKILNCTCGSSMQGYAPFILRVTTGFVFAMHGWQKLQMGIPGVSGFLGSLGFPAPDVFAVILIATELVGGIFLILGVYTHWAAKLLAFVALVAFLTVHISKGFFISNGGYEFIIMLFAAAVSVAITGPGKFSLGKKFRG